MPNISLHRQSVIMLLLLAVASYAFFFQLGSLALTDPDETFYAQTAKEMLAKDEWLTPYLYDKPQFEKPIFFYWLVELSFRVFGVSEWSARLPSAVFGLIGVIAAYFLGALLFNRRAGMFAALMLATSVEYVILSRACITDMALSTLLALAFLFFAYGYLRWKPSAYITSAFFLALAVLTKGPIGVILPLAIIGIFLLARRDFLAVRKMPLGWMALVFLAVAAPWYITMYRLHGSDFVDVFFGLHNVVRFLQPEHKTGSQAYYNVPILFGGLFPWSAFLLVGIWESVKSAVKDRAQKGTSHLFLLAWFLVFFVFFTFSSTKLPTYIFPAFLPVALMMGCVWDESLGAVRDSPLARRMRFFHYLLGAFTLAGAVTIPLALRSRYPDIVGAAAVLGGILFSGIALSCVALVRRRALASFFIIVCAVAAFLYPLPHMIFPLIERYETSRAVAKVLKVSMKPDEKIGCESNYLAGIAYYANVIPVDIDRHHNLVTLMGSEGRVWCVMKEKNHVQLYTLDTKPFHTKPSYLVWRLGKKCIVTNKPPEDGVYLTKRERVR